jgi:hypothetical protein
MFDEVVEVIKLPKFGAKACDRLRSEINPVVMSSSETL